MGNSQASPLKVAVDPQTQRSMDIETIVEYLKPGKRKNVVVMLGAGVSTSAGIPDFRSPNTGLHSKLARLGLRRPEEAFEINYFRRNPVPFYTLAAELYPGSFRPTPTHSFIKVLSAHNLLHTCFTQNIDTLERRAGVPADKIVEAHGSFATQRCIDCGAPFDDEDMRKILLRKRAPGEEVGIPRCKKAKCGGLVKPDIVFYGEGVCRAPTPSTVTDGTVTDIFYNNQLPAGFARKIFAIRKADLLLIIGTSLVVQPFALLAGLVKNSCRRVLINLECAGDIGRRPTDIVLRGECDATIRELCAALGWSEELEKAWAETTAMTPLRGAEVEDESSGEEDWKGEEVSEEEVDKITDDMGKRLGLMEG
ncbi:hypothetical protein C0992_002833 [Termitomyces sp. T32_za158]|nr:hypothetical protein C0992_002833 [Termitomyces sp. T32_za158]